MRPLQLFAAFAMPALAACGPDLSGPGPDTSLPEEHGSLVAQAGVGADLAWSPSGEELAFVSQDYHLALAYRPGAAPPVRQLYALERPGEEIRQVALSADGADWFTATMVSTGVVVRRHTTGGVEVLTDRGSGGSAFGAAGGQPLLVAAGQPLAAFVVQPDSLFLLERGGAPTLLGTGCTGVVVFSPDGSQLVCVAGGWPPAYRVFRAGGGGSEPLPLPAEVAPMALLIRWDTDGLQVLYRDVWQLGLYRHADGSTRMLTPPPERQEFLQGGVSWSANGAKVAYWKTYCAQLSGFFSCGVTQAFLYLLDVSTGAITRVAVHTLHDPNLMLQVALSPDAATLAYVVGSGLYLLELR